MPPFGLMNTCVVPRHGMGFPLAVNSCGMLVVFIFDFSVFIVVSDMMLFVAPVSQTTFIFVFCAVGDCLIVQDISLVWPSCLTIRILWELFAFF